jgi:hypothetical protein
LTGQGYYDTILINQWLKGGFKMTDVFENMRALLDERIKELKCKEAGFRKSRKQIMGLVWSVIKQFEREYDYDVTNKEFGKLVDFAWDLYEGIPEICKI